MYVCVLGLTGPGTSRVPIRTIEVDDHLAKKAGTFRADNVEYAIIVSRRSTALRGRNLGRVDDKPRGPRAVGPLRAARRYDRRG